MSKHTPGPWVLKETKHDIVISDWCVVAGDDRIGLFPYKRIYSDDRSQSGLVICHERMANAKLIAAAPELLEALQALYDYNPHNCPSCEPTNEELELWEKAKAAINKATGEQP